MAKTLRNNVKMDKCARWGNSRATLLDNRLN
ncbi:hypothetical protein COLAER_02372 [Collinsella aerofaciens ATCC 25986]|uniref:Uncharacterized protein n=1 Tax=Collinsella aerofaciens (strain ATCC 25986 / DSM 3979 / JCM 10188 / KCTC 3647 / NCTC 11838 / VPI 1003) TaxID=411903 RepID=A4ED31_COLAA|nr:hypothetical protein COLAER_02372 [Collinsella aerofaciens ATCC 25986]